MNDELQGKVVNKGIPGGNCIMKGTISIFKLVASSKVSNTTNWTSQLWLWVNMLYTSEDASMRWEPSGPSFIMRNQTENPILFQKNIKPPI